MAEVTQRDYMYAFGIYQQLNVKQDLTLPRFVDFVEAPVGCIGTTVPGISRPLTVEVTDLGKRRVEMLLGPNAHAMVRIWCIKEGRRWK